MGLAFASLARLVGGLVHRQGVTVRIGKVSRQAAVVTIWGHTIELRGEPIFVLAQARLTEQLGKSRIRCIILGYRGTDEAPRA